jgi:hypothetical protein
VILAQTGYGCKSNIEAQQCIWLFLPAAGAAAKKIQGTRFANDLTQGYRNLQRPSTLGFPRSRSTVLREISGPENKKGVLPLSAKRPVTPKRRVSTIGR